jgi:hypothetical protein
MSSPQVYETTIFDERAGAAIQVLSVPKSLLGPLRTAPLRYLANEFEVSVYGELTNANDLPRLVGLIAADRNVLDVATAAEQTLEPSFRPSENLSVELELRETTPKLYGSGASSYSRSSPRAQRPKVRDSEHGQDIREIERFFERGAEGALFPLERSPVGMHTFAELGAGGTLVGSALLVSTHTTPLAMLEIGGNLIILGITGGIAYGAYGGISQGLKLRILRRLTGQTDDNGDSD